MRVGDIIAGTNGYVSATTAKIPGIVEAIDNVIPATDELRYEWTGSNRGGVDDRVTIFVATTGAVAVAVGTVSAEIADSLSATVPAMTPVDDPNQNDLNVISLSAALWFALPLIAGLGLRAALRRNARRVVMLGHNSSHRHLPDHRRQNHRHRHH